MYKKKEYSFETKSFAKQNRSKVAQSYDFVNYEQYTQHRSLNENNYINEITESDLPNIESPKRFPRHESKAEIGKTEQAFQSFIKARKL